MITLIVAILTIFFVLSGISPLLITDDVCSVVDVERRACSCDCSRNCKAVQSQL
jgi:recombinational DNA repair ATPase RecF